MLSPDWASPLILGCAFGSGVPFALRICGAPCTTAVGAVVSSTVAPLPFVAFTITRIVEPMSASERRYVVVPPHGASDVQVTAPLGASGAASGGSALTLTQAPPVGVAPLPLVREGDRRLARGPEPRPQTRTRPSASALARAFR